MKREASMSVLFVDDEPMLLRSIAHLLEQAPLEVLTAASGADALRSRADGRWTDARLTL